MNTLIGIEIGGTKLQLVAGDASGRIIDRVRLQVERKRGGAGIREQMAGALPGLIARHRPAAVGVGFGGPVDHETGRIAKSHQIEGWSEFELGEWLHEQSGLPVRVDNDANVAALGEALAGAGRGASPVFYVTLGSGVGGGLVVDGRIYHGARPGESEIGHVRLDRTGVILEDRCSGWAVDRRLREAAAQTPGSELAKLVATAKTQGGEARFLGAALALNDPLASRILEETAGDLAFGLSHVTQLMHPAMIILGGGLALVGELLRDAVARHLRQQIMAVFGEGPQVKLAGLGEDAVPVGALLLAAG